MSPYIVAVIFVLAVLFILLSLAPFLMSSSDADAPGGAPAVESSTASTQSV